MSPGIMTFVNVLHYVKDEDLLAMLKKLLFYSDLDDGFPSKIGQAVRERGKHYCQLKEQLDSICERYLCK